MADIEPPTTHLDKRGNLTLKVKRATLAAAILFLAGLAVKWKNDKDGFDVEVSKWHEAELADRQALHGEVRDVRDDVRVGSRDLAERIDRLTVRLDSFLNATAARRFAADPGGLEP
jgi:hypothetical protein